MSLFQSIPGWLTLHLRVCSCFSMRHLHAAPQKPTVNRVTCVQLCPGQSRFDLCPGTISNSTLSFSRDPVWMKADEAALTPGSPSPAAASAQQSSTFLPSSQARCRRSLQRVGATEETKFRATCRQKSSSLFLPHSPPAPPDGKASDCSLSRRFCKKGNKKSGDENIEQTVCSSLPTCLDSLNI